MKALVLFDNTSSSLLALKAFCQDASSLTVNLRTQEPVQPFCQPEVLVLYFVNLPKEQDVISSQDYRSEVECRLAQALQLIEKSASLPKIEGEIIYCGSSNYTQAVILRAKEWQPDTIYLGLEGGKAFLVAPPSRFKSWWQQLHTLFQVKLRGGLPLSRTQQNTPDDQTPNARKFDIKTLLRQTSCKLVITDSQGVSLKLRYYSPTLSKVASKKTSSQSPRH